MDMNAYQRLAARTISSDFSTSDKELHSLHGMVGEIGELHSLYQKAYQGHMFDTKHAMKELGDCMWFIAEYCTAMGWKMSDVAEANIEKLRKRYPDGFTKEQSIHRKSDDI